MTGYLVGEPKSVLAAADSAVEQSSAIDTTTSPSPNDAAEFDQGSNPRSDYWREVRRGTSDYSAVQGLETNELIQGSGAGYVMDH